MYMKQTINSWPCMHPLTLQRTTTEDLQVKIILKSECGFLKKLTAIFLAVIKMLNKDEYMI